MCWSLFWGAGEYSPVEKKIPSTVKCSSCINQKKYSHIRISDFIKIPHACVQTCMHAGAYQYVRRGIHTRKRLERYPSQHCARVCLTLTLSKAFHEILPRWWPSHLCVSLACLLP